MAFTQQQVDDWFAANPDATPDDVAAAVKSVGGLEANTGLAGMIANRYSIAEPEVTNYYNAYTAPAGGLPTNNTVANNQTTNTVDTNAGGLSSAPADNITSTGGVTKSATAPTSGGVSSVIEGDDIDTQIAQRPEEVAHWSRSADQRYMELIDDKTGQVLQKRAVGDFSDLDLVKMGLSFVPGMGPIVSGIGALDAARKGDLIGAAIGATGLVPGMQNVNTALKVGQAIDQNNPFAAVTALAGNTDLQNKLGLGNVSVGGYTAKDAISASNLLTAAQNGQWGQVIANAGNLTNSPDTALAGRALAVLQAAESGNPNALSQAVSLFNSAVGSKDTKVTADSGTPPSGLQLAGVTDGTTSDAGSGLTLGGVDAKTQATLDALKDVDKIGTGATTAPSWVVLANDENITGTKFQSDGSQVYTIERINPNNPDEKVYYDVVKDPETGEVYYKQGGISFDEEGNVSPFGYETISGSKPSWTWKAKDEATAGTEGDKSSDTTSGLSNIDTSDTTKGASGALSTVKSNVTGADANTVATSTVGGAGGDASKTPVVGGLGGDSGTTGTKGTTGTGGTGTLDAVTGGGGGAGSGGDGTGGGTGTNSTTINNGDGTNTTVVVAPTGTVTTHECKDGFHWDEAAKACVANVVVPPVVTPPVVTPPVVTPPVVTPPVVVPPPVVTPPVVTPPVVKEPVVTSPLSSAGITSPKLDSSPQFLAGASPQKRMELAKLQQLFASLTPELAAVLSERGFQPPKYREEEKEDAKEDSKEEKSIFGNLTDGMYNPQSKFMATGGSVLDSMKPKYVESAKYLSAAPVHGTGGVDGPLKLAILKHLKQSISAPPRSMDGLAQGGLPSKYAKAAPKGHKPEFITGLTGYYAQGEGTGQSDDIPAMLHDGDYVIDADAVAALGDGSSKAGAQALSQFQSKVPHKMSSGGQAVPAKIADGEYVFPEAFVTAIGGGDNKQGSKLLDAMREELRAHKRSAPTSKIPPKAKSPLDYLRMAKG
jgi:hypothetical protein